MGIATLCAWDDLTSMPLVYCADNLDGFARLVKQRQVAISFNGLGFDNRILAHHGIEIPRSQNFDLLYELWQSDGLNPDSFNPKTHGGYSLDACCKANLSSSKTGDGAMAPINWQHNKIGEVVSYCLADVMLLRRLVKKAIANDGALNHPRFDRKGQTIKIHIPDTLK